MLPDYLESKISKVPGGCWLWTASITDTGYGNIRIKKVLYKAHRIVYELLKGPITEQTLDHLCRVRSCVNPDHLEPVSMRENLLRGQGMSGRHARQTHCAYGHEFTPENTQVIRRRTRDVVERACKICQKRRAEEVKARASAAKV